MGPRPRSPVYERVNTHHHGNRNKRNIAVNLRDEEGAAILRRLIGWGDIVVESFSAGTMERLGFGWDVVSALNPRASLISLPGWGQAGPYQGYTMTGSGFDAMVGHASVRGYPGAPVEELIAVMHSDATVPLTLVFAVLTVLQQRERTGRGCYVDMAQVEALAYELPGLMAEWSLTGRSPSRLGNADRHLVSLGSQAVRDFSGGSFFLQRQLRMGMQVCIEREPAIEFACDFLPDKWCKIASVCCGNLGLTARKIRNRKCQ